MQHDVCISGASRGIGLALARVFLERGDRVVTLARSGPDHENIAGLQADFAERHAHVVCDLGDQVSIAAAAEGIAQRCERIDLLINNAGVNALRTPEEPQHKQLGQLDGDAILSVIRINAIGPLLLTQALLPQLRASPQARVLMISSGSGSLQKRTTAGTYSYCSSKAALNMITRNLSADLGRDGPLVVAVHPGHVQTDMSQYTGMPATEAAARIAELSGRLGPEHRGAFLENDGTPLPW
ncbi:MAG: SDR family oxidoreductase [Planctomycetota bacterium]